MVEAGGFKALLRRLAVRAFGRPDYGGRRAPARRRRDPRDVTQGT